MERLFEQRRDEPVHLRKDRVLAVPAKQEIGDPERQAVEDDDIRLHDRSHAFDDLAGLFDGLEIGTAFTDMAMTTITPMNACKKIRDSFCVPPTKGP